MLCEREVVLYWCSLRNNHKMMPINPCVLLKKGALKGKDLIGIVN